MFIIYRKEKTQTFMNKTVYLVLSILQITKVVIMYGFWYDYFKEKYGKKQSYIKWTQIAL